MRRYFDVALGSLAEVDAVIAILPDLYPVCDRYTTQVEELRQVITRGLFGIIRRTAR